MPPRRNVSSPEPQPESSSSASSGSSAGPSPAAAPLRRLRQIAALARTVSSQLDLEAVLTQLSVAMKSLRPDAHCSIRLVDPAAGGYRLATEAGGFQGRAAVIPFGEGLTDVVATGRRPLLVADTRRERPTGSTASYVEQGFTAYYGTPIATGDRLFGVLNMNLPTGTLPTEEERDIIDLLADQAAIALSNADRHRDVENRARNLAALSQLMERVASKLETQDILDALVTAARDLLGAALADVWVDDPHARRLTLRARAPKDFTPEAAGPDWSRARGEGIVGRAFESGKPAYFADIQEDPELIRKGFAQDRRLHATAILPLCFGDLVVGVLGLFFSARRAFTEDEMHLMTLLANQGAVVIHRARLFEESEERRRDAEIVAGELRDRSAILEQAQGMAQIGYWVSEGGHGESLQWSTGTYRIFGLEPGTFDGRSESFFAMVHPEDMEAVRRASVAARAGNAPYRIDHRIVWRDGSVRWVHQRAEVQRDPQGRPVRMLGVVQDITAHKEVEDILRDRVTQTRRTAEQLSSLIHSSAVAINALDLDGRILMWNPASERLFGWRADEVLGEPSPHVTEAQRAAVARVLDQARREVALEPYEAQRERKDGSRIDVVVYPAPLRDAEGRLTGIIGVIVDVTERNRLDEQLRQAQKMEGIGRLAGGIAHDFNNLLTVILGRTTLMLGRIEGEHLLRRDVQLIQMTAERAATLTRQLLAFSRKQVLQPAVVNLNSVVAELEPMLHRLIGEDIAIATRLEATVGQVKVDRGQIEQVIVNLVVNARDAMPDGGRLTLETTNATLPESHARDHTTVPGDYLMLAVSDTGVGMSAEVQSRLFEPFFTTKGPGKGTGLGLATVYGIVKQSGGSIGVYS
jgi:PAS domain S-box-containing protein